MAVMHKIVIKKLPSKPSSEEGSELSDEIWIVMQQCWNHAPNERPTALRVAELLREIPQPELTKSRINLQNPKGKGRSDTETDTLPVQSVRDIQRNFSEEEINLLNEYESKCYLDNTPSL